MSLQQAIQGIQAELEGKFEMYETIIKELEELTLKKTLIEAELTGLEQRLRVLTDAAARAEGSSASSTQTPPPLGSQPAKTDLTKLTMVDAIVYAIKDSDSPLGIDEVRRRLEEYGRSDDPNSVSVTLSYAATSGRIRRVARGLYGAADGSNT